MILERIRTDPGIRARWSVWPGVFITRSGWIFGPYRALAGRGGLALALRDNAEVRERFLGEPGVRVGRRRIDQVPGPERGPTSFKPAIAGKSPKAPSGPVLAGMANREHGSTTMRQTEQYDEIRDFYKGKTLEAHHVVEKSVLGQLGVNHGDLADSLAPCVLVVAELHQQMFTPEVARARVLFGAGPTNLEKVQSLQRLYLVPSAEWDRGLYAGDPLFKDLCHAAKHIIREAATRLGVVQG